jgi:RNA polymerase sigma-70 factor, ECF subfamily
MTEDQESIDRLIDQFRAGIDRDREEAFRNLFLRFHPHVCRFFERKGFSKDESRDLTQRTFLQVSRTLDAFHRESKFETWLFAVVTNVYRNELRRLSTLKREALEVSLDGEVSPAKLNALAQEAGSLDQVIEKERIKALWVAVQELSPKRRDCIKLRAQGLNVQEISEVLMISPGTVRVHLHQARQWLKVRLAESGNLFDEF